MVSACNGSNHPTAVPVFPFSTDEYSIHPPAPSQRVYVVRVDQSPPLAASLLFSPEGAHLKWVVGSEPDIHSE